MAETVELHRLAGAEYTPTPKQSDGLLRRDALPGFEIPARAIFDDQENVQALRQLMAVE